MNGAEADGVVVDVDSLVSMNMWGLTPEFSGCSGRRLQSVLPEGSTEQSSESRVSDPNLHR